MHKIAQNVYSRHRVNFFILHSFRICVHKLYSKSFHRKSFQITLKENTDRQCYIYLVMHLVLTGLTDHMRFFSSGDIIDIHYIYKKNWNIHYQSITFSIKTKWSKKHKSFKLWFKKHLLSRIEETCVSKS